MGMVAKLIVEDSDSAKLLQTQIEDLFNVIDNKFSSYKKTSDITKLNSGDLSILKDHELSWILSECDKTKSETDGYFDCKYNKIVDPSGLVKGYAINQAAKILTTSGQKNYLIEISGDVQTSGLNNEGNPWQIGIENPFKKGEVIKIVKLSGQGIATSGTSIHPDHIINPLTNKPAHEIVSISVIAASIYDADRFATAAFAMGEKGIEFIQGLPGFAGYMITNDKQGIMTESFKQYV